MVSGGIFALPLLLLGCGAVALTLVAICWFTVARPLRLIRTAPNRHARFDSLITAAALADATLASVPLAEAALTMNGHVFDALDRWTVHSHDAWSLVDYVKDHYATIFAPDNGFIDGLKGYVAESIVGDHFAALGHHVVMATTTNQPGWDLLIDGQEFQVKAGATAAQAAHHALGVNPDIPIITDPSAAAHLAQLDPNSVVAVHEIGAAHLEATTTQTLHGMDAVAHAGSMHLPLVTVAFSAGKELGLLIDGHTTFATAAAHVATDTVGVGVGIAAGAKAGALAGAVFGPHGMAIGGILGSIFGGVTGRFGAKALKEAKLRGLIEQYDAEAQTARALFATVREAAATRFQTSLVRWDRELRRDRKAFARGLSRERRVVAAARSYASFRLQMTLRLTALTNGAHRAEIFAVLRALRGDIARGASMLAGLLDHAEDVKFSYTLRRQLEDLVAVYGTASAIMAESTSRYGGLIERRDIESRTLAAEILIDLTNQAKTLFARATKLMEEIRVESRSLGRPLPAAPRLMLPAPKKT